MADRYLDGLERAARERLSDVVLDYFARGARDGVTTAEAEVAWDRIRLMPRVLMDVTSVSTATTLLGAEVGSPIGIAPTTLQRAAHPDGEEAVAVAAREAGSLMVVSSNAGTTFDRIGSTGTTWWLQMYVTADRGATVPVVERAKEAGARALVLTADTPVVGTKYGGDGVWDVIDPGWLRLNLDEATPGAEAGLEKATDLGPHDIAWLADRFDLPVVVKGVLHPQDARRCVDAGAAAVWVSNHGGRQLDGAAATADCLGPVVDEVAGAVEVYVDGGVRRGRHVLVAGALGARAVFLGRPLLYALADGGSAGVSRLLEEVRAELVESLRLAGATNLGTVARDLLAPGSLRGTAPPT